ncbi:hypothetical protein [Xylocopilactobacillus apicola]|uniref:WYL domain-containing protein n=1 Tax=Xylocopilactobacillus apicola TaxID=2932184 RepID=A0AAU9DLC0_9LACO|nr:hypothetical protein [Xylocopilactobacillus apicola]BDR59371.1 hypothetical protein XA3_18120 [Xylocopilactobacillus apicola]
MKKEDLIELLSSIIEEDAVISRIYNLFHVYYKYEIKLLDEIVKYGIQNGFFDVEAPGDSDKLFTEIKWSQNNISQEIILNGHEEVIKMVFAKKPKIPKLFTCFLRNNCLALQKGIMYKLISINNFEYTRLVKLKNLNTANVETCFDDSAITSSENFEFMKINEKYNCKIYLFGYFDEDGVQLKYLKRVKVGSKNLIEVLDVLGNVYYVDDTQDSYGAKVSYRFSRMDLIQVDNCIYPDFR